MKTTFYLLILLSFTRCVTIYVPTPQNSPMFTKKNEFQGAASFGTTSNVRIAYSFTKHFGITANYLHADDRAFNNKVFSGERWRKHTVGEFAIGYYTRTRNNLYLDIFTGGGWGGGKAEDVVVTSGFFVVTEDYYKASASYYKFYVQPSFGGNVRIFSWNGSVRITYVNFTHVDVTRDYEPVSFGEKGNWVLSPGGEFRVTIMKNKLYGTAQAAAVLLPRQEGEILYYGQVSFTAGILLKL